MKEILKQLVLQEGGQTMAEYAVVAALMAAALAGVNRMMSGAALKLFKNVSQSSMPMNFGGAGVRLWRKNIRRWP